MKILTVDVGTGTQDIFLYDSQLAIENGYKLILPSPTMIARGKIQAATRSRMPILLSGVTMGGGPNVWAIDDHIKAGCPVFATPEAAKTIDDDLDQVIRRGVVILSEDEAINLKPEIKRIAFKDFDFSILRKTFANFNINLDDLTAVSIAVFDHGEAPPGCSDRQFRFDYLDQRIRAKNALSTFAFRSEDVPSIMTRMQSVVDSAPDLEVPLILMDTAPAAILGATYDPFVKHLEHRLIVNAGNFHSLAFRLRGSTIEGLFEHHSGLVDLSKLEKLLCALADGSLEHDLVFNDHGHGALIYQKTPFPSTDQRLDIVVTGPRRGIFHTKNRNATFLSPHYAVPFGDMMLCGNIGLLSATGDLLPHTTEAINISLKDSGARFLPWETP